MYKKATLLVSLVLSILQGASQDTIYVSAEIKESEQYQENKTKSIQHYHSLQLEGHSDSLYAKNSSQPIIRLRYEQEPKADEAECTTKHFRLSDDGSLLVELPFSFDFYGISYWNIWVNNNGNISMNESVGAYRPQSFPLVVPMIAPLWTDLENTDHSQSGITLIQSRESLIVRWNHMKIKDIKSQHDLTFAVKLESDMDEITFTYYQSPSSTDELSLVNLTCVEGINAGNSEEFQMIKAFPFDMTLSKKKD